MEDKTTERKDLSVGPLFSEDALQRLRSELSFRMMMDPLITACDEALNWADANARWFDISTAPREVGDEFLAINGGDMASLNHIYRDDEGYMIWAKGGLVDLEDCFTHWMPIQNPPLGQLPEPFERLGEVLRRVKGVG